MEHEPSEIRMATDRTSRRNRHDAVREARRVVLQATGSDKKRANTTYVLDAAFAELPEREPESGEKLSIRLVDQISTQLQQLDAQRDHLQSLLDSAK